jgi:hypothetical protein
VGVEVFVGVRVGVRVAVLRAGATCAPAEAGCETPKTNTTSRNKARMDMTENFDRMRLSFVEMTTDGLIVVYYR